MQAGLFFLKHADTGEKDLPARELHELLLLSLQWLSGMITQSNPYVIYLKLNNSDFHLIIMCSNLYLDFTRVYPLHLLREIETRVWLLAVESEAQLKSEGDFTSNCFSKDTGNGNSINIIDRAANIITKMDNHITTVRSKTLEKHDGRDISQVHHRNQIFDTSSSTIAGGSTKTKRRAKGYVPPRRAVMDFMEKSIDSEDSLSSLNFKNDLQFHDESVKLEISFSKWEEKIDPAELERAVLSLLEFGQVTAAKQLQHKLSPGPVTPELLLADAALKLAAMSTPSRKLLLSMLDEEVRSVFKSYKIQTVEHLVNPLQVIVLICCFLLLTPKHAETKMIFTLLSVEKAESNFLFRLNYSFALFALAYFNANHMVFLVQFCHCFLAFLSLYLKFLRYCLILLLFFPL